MMYLVRILVANLLLLRRSISFVATSKWRLQLLLRSNTMNTIFQKIIAPKEQIKQQHYFSSKL